MVRNVAACLAVLLALFEVGSCLHCYQCNSEKDKTCVDASYAKPGSHLLDCHNRSSITYFNTENLYNTLPNDFFGGDSSANTSTYCHKIFTESGTVIRACIDVKSLQMNDTCERMIALPMSENKTKIKNCFVCDKDSCNGAGSLSFSLPLALAAVLASYLIYKQ